MKKMVKVAAIAAMVLSVALTGCNGKKGEASSSSTEVSEESNSPAASRKQINAFLKDYEKFVKKAEKAAEKGDKSSFESLSEEQNKFNERFSELGSGSAGDWNESDGTKIFELGLRCAGALSKLMQD